MPYRLHATKRSLYKLTADKIVGLPWCKLPKISEVEFVACQTSYFLRWPYHEVFFSTLPDAPVVSITQYDYAPSDNVKHERNREICRLTLSELNERSMMKEVPAHKIKCVPMEHAG